MVKVGDKALDYNENFALYLVTRYGEHSVSVLSLSMSYYQAGSYSLCAFVTKSFVLVPSTRNPAPDIPPDATALLSIVNFTVTRSGLEGN